MPGKSLAAAARMTVAFLLAASWASPVARSAVKSDGWQSSSPAAEGFDAGALDAVLAGVAAGKMNIHGVIVERHGRLVAELYRKGPDHPINVLFGLGNPFAGKIEFGPEILHDVRSISKSIVGLLVGIAQQQGRISSLATPVENYFPAEVAPHAPARAAITLEHLLTMSSGLAWDETGSPPNDETRLFWKSEPAHYVLGRPIAAPPGEEFNYNSGGVAVLAEILVRTSGQSLSELARTELFTPLGITEWEWAANLHGRELAFVGLRLRPRDLAKFGRLVLDHGRWQGRQLIPAEWVAESLRPHVTTPFKSPPTAADNLQYGYLWWTGSVDWQGRKLGWSAGFGNGGQRLFVVPDLDLTVVITTGAYDSAAINSTVNQLLQQVVSTVVK